MKNQLTKEEVKKIKALKKLNLDSKELKKQKK
jgi:Asp-tRNA(Asn)/Glu-tRNA(Gln) amidotransferase C subunit